MNEEPDQPQEDSPRIVAVETTRITIWRQTTYFQLPAARRSLWRAARAFLRERRGDLRWMVSISIGLLILEFYGFFSGFEGQTFDWYLAFDQRLGVVSGQPPDKKVLIVDIDDSAYTGCLGGESPLHSDHAAQKLDRLVQLILKQNPAVVTVDLLTKPGALPIASKDPRVVMAAEVKPHKNVISFWGWLAGPENPLFQGELPLKPDLAANVYGVPSYPVDEDAGIRRLPRFFRWDIHDQLHPVAERTLYSLSLLTKMKYRPSEAGALEMTSKELMISYSGGPPARIPAGHILKCGSNQNQNPDPGDYSGRVVLIGGTYARSEDLHRTPLGEQTPGVVVNAYAIESELNGAYIGNAAPRQLFVLDLLFGIVLSWIIWRLRPGSAKQLIQINGVALAGFISLSFLWFIVKRVIWAKWYTALIGATAGFVIEMYDKDPPLPESD